jgi:hypothetical protein
MKTKVKFNPIPKDIVDYLAYSEEAIAGLINKVDRSRAKTGQEVGRLTSAGYFQFRFRYNFYLNSRIVYFLCTGIDPEEKTVDHVDTNPLNNKISNLRLTTHGQNQDNKSRQKNNTSGVTGVSWRREGKWIVLIKQFNRQFNLGVFDDFNEAVAVRIAAEHRLKGEYRNNHNDQYKLTPEMLEWGKKNLEDRIERLNWDI